MKIFSLDIKNDIVDKKFIDWFVGFSDAESCFIIKKSSKKINNFEFIFRIGLYKDDSKLLITIQKYLGIGKIYYSGNRVFYDISKQNEIKILLKIFERFPLNSIKHLNYLNFKFAFELYTTSFKIPEITA